MTRPFLGPRLIVGTILGVALGLLAVFNIYFAGAAVLAGLAVLGYRTEKKTSDFWAAHGHLFAEPADKHRDSEVARANRAAYWNRFSLSGFPREQHNGRHIDRPFAAQAECENGHIDFHPIGETFERDGIRRIARRCVNYPECTSLWSELA